MIDDDQQLSTTRAWLHRFRTALGKAQQRKPSPEHAWAHKAECDGMSSIIADLEQEIAEYQRRKHA